MLGKVYRHLLAIYSVYRVPIPQLQQTFKSIPHFLQPQMSFTKQFD